MKLFRLALAAIAAVMGCVVVARMLFGPFRVLAPVNIPLNPEGIFGFAIVLLLATSAIQPRPGFSLSRRSALLWSIAVALVCLAGLGRALRIGFLSDDFILVRIANGWSVHNVWPIFTTGGGDGFFRPVGYLSLALDAAWARVNPVLWHASVLAWHTCNSLLVMLLARRMGASATAAGLAAALFAIHGTRTETAVWIAGRFDLLSTFFFLAAFLLFTMSRERYTVSYALLTVSLLFFVLAAFTKESAYIFPLVLVPYVIVKRQSWRSTIPFFAAAGLVFAYRWWLLGGIGGYSSQGGRPLILSLGFASTLKVLAIRLWTYLFFPINWTSNPSLLLAALAALYIAAMLWLAMRTKTAAALWPIWASLLIAVIPPLHLLSGSASLSGARLLYLPSVWFCILLALALDGLPARSRLAVAGAILAFHAAALEHNLNAWEYASAKVDSACELASAASAKKVVVLDLPGEIRGVPSFANGFADCVKLHGRPDTEVEVVRGPVLEKAADTLYLRWNPVSEKLE